MEKLSPSPGSRLTTFFLVGIIAVFVALFAILAVKGSYSRYAQDDYCYGYRVRLDNFWSAQVKSYFQTAEYNSDRYALTFFNGLSERIGGPKFAPFLPALVMLSWVGILVYIFSLILRDRRKILIALSAALTVVLLTFILSPNIYQVLFWLASINTYTTPVVIAALAFARMFHFTLRGRFTIFNLLELAFLNLLAGGFSETVTAWLLTLWCCSFILLFFFSRQDLFKKARWPLLTAFTATLIAAVLMLVNPTNSIRAAYYHPQGLLQMLWRSLSYGLLFVKRSIKFAPLSFVFIFLMGFLLSSQTVAAKSENWKKWLFNIAALLAVTYLLCAAVMAPSVLLMDSYPGDRQLFPATFSLVCGIFSAGWASEKLLSSFPISAFPQKLANPAFLILAVALIAYLGTQFPVVYDRLPLYQARAVAWDARQQIILDSKSAGRLDITIPAFDSIYGITEIGSDPANWVNRCAAWYYGVNSITAEDGYMGFDAYPIGK